ncbi:caspase family protein [Nostoc sp.]|uniref:caspase family protein n=1 Tax=Nostoc sp. TaxID=1180 RepID=UPI002FF0BBFC
MSRDALVVGINTYDRLKSLNAPAADGEAIAQILQQYGEFRVMRLPAVKDKENETIRIGKQTKVSLTQLERAIVQLFKPDGKPPDTALLYFSGHGLRKNLGIQEGFLATSEVNPEVTPAKPEATPVKPEVTPVTLKPLPGTLHLI